MPTNWKDEIGNQRIPQRTWLRMPVTPMVEAAYTQPIKEAHEKAKEVLKTATEPMKTKLDTEFKAYEPKAAAHDNAVTGHVSKGEGHLARLPLIFRPMQLLRAHCR